MIIEGKSFYDVELVESNESSMRIMQASDEMDCYDEPIIDVIIIDKHQATQLIAVIQKWVDGEELE